MTESRQVIKNHLYESMSKEELAEELANSWTEEEVEEFETNSKERCESCCQLFNDWDLSMDSLCDECEE
jgi:hypothetical protein